MGTRVRSCVKITGRCWRGDPAARFEESSEERLCSPKSNLPALLDRGSGWKRTGLVCMTESALPTYILGRGDPIRMADFYPLVARAVERLPERSPDRRRAIYKRARSALTDQLRALDPPLSNRELARLQRSLEDAINRVEAHYRAPTPAPQPPPIVKPLEARCQPSKPAEAVVPAPKADPPPSQQSSSEAPPGGGQVVESGSTGANAYTPEYEQPRSEAVIADTSAPRSNAIRLGLMVLLVIGASAAAAWLLRDKPLGRPEPPATAEGQRVPESGSESSESVSGERTPGAPPSPSSAEQTPATQPSASAAEQAPTPPPSSPVLEQRPDISPSPPASPADQTAVDPAPSPPAADLPDTPRSLPAPEQVPADTPPSPPRTEPALQAASPPVASAQRAVLYEENQGAPEAPRATAGSAGWRLEVISAGQGRSSETVVHSAVEVPEAGLTLDMILRRNPDAALPASHTVELRFTTPNDPSRTVRDVGILQLKTAEAVRGTPLAGLPVPVKENVFLIGLSSLPADINNNTDLLLKHNWMDLPIHFASGLRAILTFEKGTSGERVLEDAFREWRGPPAPDHDAE